MVGVVTDECRKALQMCGTAYTASLGSLTRYGWPPKIPWGLKHGLRQRRLICMLCFCVITCVSEAAVSLGCGPMNRM
jgi:hypothetical protein